MKPHQLTPSPASPILAIGAAGMDVIGRLESSLRGGTSNPARIRRSYGGVARNVAENLARLGQPVRLLTAVGADESGDDLLAYTEATGVDVSAVLRSENFPTGFYMAALNERGQLEFAMDDMRVMSELTSEYLREHEEAFREAGLVFLDANLPPRTIRTAFSLARKAKIPVCADPTSTLLAERLKKYLPRLYVVTPNSAEAAILADTTIENWDREAGMDAARKLVEKGVHIALVTLAEFGVCYASSDITGHIPAIRTQISDPTGAGDALTAAILFALMNDIPLDDAIRLGVSAASLTLHHAGSVAPSLSLERLYDQISL